VKKFDSTDDLHGIQSNTGPVTIPIKFHYMNQNDNINDYQNDII
jgi:hypothetical protein